MPEIRAYLEPDDNVVTFGFVEAREVVNLLDGVVVPGECSSSELCATCGHVGLYVVD